MKIVPLAGIMLIRRQVAQVGSLHATKEEHKTIPLHSRARRFGSCRWGCVVVRQ